MRHEQSENLGKRIDSVEEEAQKYGASTGG